MTKDFMKSAGFHVKSKDLLQGIVTLCFTELAEHSKLNRGVPGSFPR